MTKRSTRRHSSVPLIIVGVGLIIISAVVLVFTTREKTPEPVTVGVYPAPAFVTNPAPKLELFDLSGRTVSLSELKGKVILVNNWATWCPPCREEMPALQAFSETHSEDEFILVGINAGDSKEKVAKFIDDYNLTFPIWLDPSGDALRAFQNNGLPSSYVIDQNGEIRMVWMGRVTLEALEAYVTPLFTD